MDNQLGRILDYQNAVKTGASDQDIMSYLQQNPNVQLTNAPQQQPQQQQSQPQQQQPQQNGGDNNFFNNVLRFGLPAAGGLVGAGVGGAVMPFGGEIAGGAVGAAGGQALADVLTGKQPGWDVPLTGGLSAAGGLVAKGIGGLLSRGGEEMATGGLNLTKTAMNKLEQSNGEPVLQTLLKNKLAGSNAGALDDALSGLYAQQDVIAKQVPLKYDTFAQYADEALSKLRDSPVSSVQGLYPKVSTEVNNILDKMSTGNASLDEILSNFDAATKQSQFGSAEWGVNRYVGNILRKTMYDTAEQMGMPGLKDLGINLSRLQDISSAAGLREGVGGGGNGIFSLPNLFEGDVGLHVANAMGANPLLAAILPGLNIAGGLVQKNPAIAGLASQALSGGGQALSSGAPLLGASLAGAGGAGLSTMQSPPESVNAQGNENNSQNNLSQSNQPPSSYSIAGGGQNSNTVQTQYGNLPRQLPAPSAIANQIPGQIYPQEQYLSDIKRITDWAAQNPYSPGVQTQADLMKQEFEAKRAQNEQNNTLYVNQNPLSADQQDFIKNAQPDWNNLTKLHDLLQTDGAKNIVSSYIQANPLAQNFLAAQHPEYALLFNLMNQARFAQAKQAQGGRVTQYDLALMTAFRPGATAQANLTNLEYGMHQFATQYQQYAPLYGMSQQKIPDKLSGGDLMNYLSGQINQ